MDASLLAKVRQQLAPGGTLRVALNMSNFLLVNSTSDNGEPDGVSPALARSIADDLGVPLQFICYKGPGLIADAATRNEWDIANIAAEPARAKVISFSPAYCEIQASYLVPPDSAIKKLSDIDQPGVRIAVKERAAYDLWLTANLKHAALHHADSLDASFELFQNENLEALAGLKPKLIEQQQLMPGSILLDESFTSVQQSVGCNPGQPEAEEFLVKFVTNAIKSGAVASFIEEFGVTGKLSVASV